MKRIVVLLATFFIVCLSTVASADDWQALVTDAYSKADLVLSGTVQSVDNQTAVDGGHVYRLQVTGENKGAAKEQVLVRAGGFFYTVPLEVDESVLVFLKSVNGGQFSAGSPAYSLVEVATLRPMVFKESGAYARPVDSRLGPEFANVTSAEVKNLLSSLKP